MTTDTNEQPKASKAPSHIAYHIVKRGDKSFTNPVGAMWAHGKGGGFNLQLDVVPLDGRITLFIPSEKTK